MTTFSPQVLGQAENALRALLARTLAGSGVGYHEWVLMNATAKCGGEADRGRLTAIASDALKITTADVDAALDRISAYVVVTQETVRMTDHGFAWYSDRSAEVGAHTKLLFGGIDEDDLDATGRVLVTLTERANGLLAA